MGENKFDATASMVGYFYQCRYALFAAIVAVREKPSAEISIEKLDDVAFEQSGLPIELIQTKHHIHEEGTTADALRIGVFAPGNRLTSPVAGGAAEKHRDGAPAVASGE